MQMAFSTHRCSISGTIPVSSGSYPCQYGWRSPSALTGIPESAVSSSGEDMKAIPRWSGSPFFDIMDRHCRYQASTADHEKFIAQRFLQFTKADPCVVYSVPGGMDCCLIPFHHDIEDGIGIQFHLFPHGKKCYLFCILQIRSLLFDSQIRQIYFTIISFFFPQIRQQQQICFKKRYCSLRSP